jgi:hypothetical protein
MSFNKKFLNKSPLTSHGGPHSNKEKLKPLSVDLNLAGRVAADISGVSGSIPDLQKNYNKLVDFYNKRPTSGSMTDEEKNYRASLYQTINKENIRKGLKGKIKNVDDIKNISSTVGAFNETLKSKLEGRTSTGKRVAKAKASNLVHYGDRRKEIQLRALGLFDETKKGMSESYYMQSDFGKNFIQPKDLTSLKPEYLEGLKQKIKEQGGELEGSKVKIPNYRTKGGKATIENGKVVFSRESGLSGLGNASKSYMASLLGADDELKQIKNQYSKLFNPVKEKFYLK